MTVGFIKEVDWVSEEEKEMEVDKEREVEEERKRKSEHMEWRRREDEKLLEEDKRVKREEERKMRDAGYNLNSKDGCWDKWNQHSQSWNVWDPVERCLIEQDPITRKWYKKSDTWKIQNYDDYGHFS
jgi:flagellar biosynthesis GTPase FlhF